MADKLKLLQRTIADKLDSITGTTHMTRARRVLNLINPHFEELSIAAYNIGRQTDSFEELEIQLKEQGLLPKSCDLNSRFEKILSRYE